MATPTAAVRTPRLLVFIWCFMALGTGAELALLGHYEDVWQRLPLGLLAVSLLSFVLLLAKPTRALRGVFRGLLLGCMVSGALGAWFHLRANWEFEVELYPTRSWMETLSGSLSGALPALAPGSMVVLGLLGWFYIEHFLNKRI